MKKRTDQKVIGVIAEQRFIDCVEHIAKNNEVDIYKIRFDCFQKGQLTEKNIELLRHAPNRGNIMASMRHRDTVLPDRQEFEGFKYEDHPLKVTVENRIEDRDLDRIYWLRQAAQEYRMPYFEIEHDRRKGFILLGGNLAPKAVVRYTNLNMTPSLEDLNKVYDEIVRKGADHIVIETYVRNQGKDNGQKDRKSLFDLAEQKLNGPKPLTIVGLGKYGGRVNVESYKAGLSQFAFGVFPSFSFIPWMQQKRAHNNLPTVDHLRKELDKN